MKPSIQIYGQFGDFWSNACVSRGIASAFASHRWQTTIHDRNGQYDGLWFNAVCGMDEADVGLYVGYAVRATELLAGHAIKVGAFIAESASVPQEWAACANICDLIIVPSRWTAQAYIRGGVDPTKVIVAHHGLHPCFAKPDRPVPPAGRFLHVAGARDFLERKGTPQLIEAWKQLPRDVGQLVIRTPTSPTLQTSVAGLDGRVVFDFHDVAMRPEEMKQYLLKGGWDAIIQPSRAEAFGLLPCEARACGIPVIMTACAGHSEHVDYNDTIIETGLEAPIKANGIPNGLAPTVAIASIVTAVIDFKLNEDKRRRLASIMVDGRYAARWAWPVVLRKVVEKLAPPRKRRL